MMRRKHTHAISAQKSSSIIKKKTTITLSPARKSRTKTRKPKYLSLRLQISPENTRQNMPTGHDRRHQLNLFPLHPENLVEDKDTHDDNNVAHFFSTVDGGATTLTALLGPGASSSAPHHQDDNNNAATLSPESLKYAYGGQDSEEVEQQLVRTAMRNKAREPSEEKWVSCCSPASVSVSDLRCKNDERRTIQRQRLSLKLDYEEIMNAWSDKGPLYIHVDSPQVVPDLNDDDFFSHPSTNGWGTSGGLWKVPEMNGIKSLGCITVEEVQGGGEEWKLGRREASVLRYREKRQNRLFSKKIRYEVRKLNAEKRPRIKGRFVKRN